MQAGGPRSHSHTNAPAARPRRCCSDHLRVRSEMSLGGPFPDASHPCWQPKCTIYHDVTGSAPEGPLDRTLGLHGSVRMEQGKDPSGSSWNPGGSWEISHSKQRRQPNSESLPLANWRQHSRSAASRLRQDGQATCGTQAAAQVRNRPTWS